MTINNSKTFDILSQSLGDILLSVSENTDLSELDSFIEAHMQDVSDTDNSDYLSVELICAYGQKIVEKLEEHLENHHNQDLFNAFFITSGWDQKFYRSQILFSPVR